MSEHQTKASLVNSLKDTAVILAQCSFDVVTLTKSRRILQAQFINDHFTSTERQFQLASKEQHVLFIRYFNVNKLEPILFTLPINNFEQ